jgi:glycerol-3-phosphate dehydrogenase
MNSSLNAERRARELAGLAGGEVVDLLVIGLGVTGAGVALDAASRGLSVAAIDAHDLAFGTSRWSSKLVHGGLRYLARGDIAVAHESAVERGVLMEHTAPHLVRALPMLLSLTPAVSRPGGLLAGAGFRAGDVLRASARTSSRTLPRPRRLSATETLRLVPSLRPDGLRGGRLSWDGQLEDDARLVVALARTAAAHGARIITRARAVEVAGDGAVVRDELTGDQVVVRARAVINATGVWAGGLVPNVALRPSRGSHIVLRGDLFEGGLRAAVTVPVPGEFSRYVFALPQPDGLVYVGLTDEPVDGPIPDVPEAPEADIGFLLDVISSAFEVAIRRSDVVGAYAGLRPLLESGGRTSDVSRKHAVLSSPDGVVTVVGGKLTTYRQMAEDAVDTVVGARGLTAGPCRTKRLPLVGAGSRAALAEVVAPARLVRRYGLEAVDVVASTGGDPALLEPIGPGTQVTGAEIGWALRHEGALDIDDVLDRRTRIGLVPADRAVVLPAVRALVENVAG